MTERVSISLYRIAQECLTNVAKHADACNVLMELSGKIRGVDRLVRFSVEDDGVGMDPDSAHRGLGLIGIRERVEALEGEFELQASPGEGVRIALVLPLDARDAEAGGQAA